MPTPFLTTRRVEFRETDAAGITHFTSFFGYMEEAEHALLRDLGLSVLADYGDYHLSWPRVSARCDYRAPVRFEEVMSIEAWVERLGTKAVTYRFLFRVGDRLIAEGEMVAVCCRIQHGALAESIPIPAEIAERLATRRVQA